MGRHLPPGAAAPGPGGAQTSPPLTAPGGEAAARAARQAQAEGLQKVDVEHVEKVLPQLLLDF
nr:PREDICTED: centromere protein X [Opisthocomus hoazin]